MEKVDEVYGEGNEYTTEFRQYDPRVGRWLSPDPKMSKYPSWSPYVFAFDNPIAFNDVLGDEPPDVTELFKKLSGSKTFIQIAKAANITIDNVQKEVKYDPYNTANSRKGDITLFKFDSYVELLLGLTHEVTNRKNLKKLHDEDRAVKWGDISPEKYALNIIGIEAEGFANQVIVAAELDIKTDNEYFNETVKLYKDNQTDKGAIIAAVKANPNMLVGSDAGQDLIAQYTEQGNKLRAQGEAREKLIKEKGGNLNAYKKREAATFKSFRKEKGIKGG